MITRTSDDVEEFIANLVQIARVTNEAVGITMKVSTSLGVENLGFIIPPPDKKTSVEIATGGGVLSMQELLSSLHLPLWLKKSLSKESKE